MTGLLEKNSDRAVEVGERKESRESEGRRKLGRWAVLVGEFHVLSKG